MLNPQIIDEKELEEWKKERKVLFASGNAHDGIKKSLYVDLNGNSQIYHGEEFVMTVADDEKAVKEYNEI